jgi:phosphogluconate dehydratase
MTIHARIGEVTDRIVSRSHDGRSRYLDRIRSAASKQPTRKKLGCANLAHGFAACGPTDKAELAQGDAPNIGIITAYNDMLSAHQPYERYPELIRNAARASGAVAQVAGSVPAMCDGVTQGEAGMELSLFSRDVIALGAAVGLSHQMFDAALYLGICDKIVPGLVIAALSFGHLPGIFVPAGPMGSGMSNDEKSRIRQLYAEGKIGKAELLDGESKSYHSPGTCTFYGTANSNQMLMEMMGLHLPGASFVNPNTPLRDALTTASVKRALEITASGNEYTPVGEILDEKAFVNGVIGLHATGGSTNHTLHLVAMARAAGITLTWQDFSDLADVVPLVARVYPNGSADVNAFREAGGIQYVIRTLLDDGLLHKDVRTVWGSGLDGYLVTPKLNDDNVLTFVPAPETSQNDAVLRPASAPFQATGGLKLLTGNLGKAVIKTSAVKAERHVIEAPAKVFHSQEEMQAAFKAGDLTGDFIAVVRFQGPKANGMPELHKLTPPLGVLQDRGQRVALVTDGRMSGASGKVPAAIHVTPEAADGGPIGRIRDGDILRLDAITGELNALVPAADWAARVPVVADLSSNQAGVGRDLFTNFRRFVGPADEGASSI